MMDLKPGDRVVLRGYPKGHPDFPEGLPEEVIIIDGPSGPEMWIGTLEAKYWDEHETDGIREFHEDQIHLVVK